MWSNAFCQTVDFEFPDRSGAILRFSGFGLRRIIAHPSGDWSVVLKSGERVDVELVRGWAAGGMRAVGLQWEARDRRRFSCGLCCLSPSQDPWRRLLVRLRVPMSPRLS